VAGGATEVVVHDAHARVVEASRDGHIVDGVGVDETTSQAERLRIWSALRTENWTSADLVHLVGGGGRHHGALCYKCEGRSAFGAPRY
jgi:hypothetical protein